MRVAVSEGRVRVSAYELSYFSRTKNSGGLRMFRFNKRTEKEYLSPGGEVELSEDAFDCFGSHDGFSRRQSVAVMEKVRFVSRLSSKVSPYSDPRFLCEAFLTAYIACRCYSLTKITLRVTVFCDRDAKSISFDCTVDMATLEKMWKGVCARAIPFIEIEAQRKTEGKKLMQKMPFPYSEIREGQRDFINDTFHAAKTGSRLMVCAPTGIGKTVSALYPSVRAIGAGYVDRIFYLTAKTVTGKAAADAVRAMSAFVPTLRCIFVSAKDRVCSMKDGAKSGCAFVCPMMSPLENTPYEARRDAAILQLLRGDNVITTDAIRAAAEKYMVCPYELSLDTSEFCEVIICDYNYVFDSHVRFRRYFTESTERHMLLIDEAHNLPDRAREMYSATLKSLTFTRLYTEETELLASYPELKRSLSAVIKEFQKVVLLCKEEEQTVGEVSLGWYLTSEIPAEPSNTLMEFCRISKKISSEIEENSLLERAYEEARAYVLAVEEGVSNSVFFAETEGAKLKISIRCLDPSDKLDMMMKSAHASVLFSATFTPMDYFADILGCRDAARLELDSPYDPDKLCVIGVNSVSSRYSQRKNSAPEIAEMIYSVIDAKEGNYIAYFPSYEYMMQVYREFASVADGIKIVLQKRSMSLAERDRFLSEFREGREETLIGFCVLGGAFAEGVDLAGERLIGTIIVGIGLPKITSEQNLLKEYFDNTRENGYDYAFTYPSMIKVQQAAGRVIRGENDCGVVVLMDDRYMEPPIMKLLPKHWRKIKFVSDPYVLSSALERFWEKNDI